MALLPNLSGIQQIGIGNASVYDTWEWYRKHLGFNVAVFDEAAEAALMLPYTGGEPRSRHAVLALNMMGGGGAEIWQYTTRTPQPPINKTKLGDLGIHIAKYKSPDIAASWDALQGQKLLSTKIHIDPLGQKHFYLKDAFENAIELVESKDWFDKGKFHCGGVYGAVIGVTDINASIEFYNNILGYDQILHDSTSVFEDLAGLNNGGSKFRRVVLTHKEKRTGPFSKLFGSSQLELIQSIESPVTKIFEDRMWGDLGYIHLCFDVMGMDEMRMKCKNSNCAFTVDSGDFDMGEAAGQFAYIEDPDGTLIEFVETHKVPILKKIGFYLNMKKRDPNKDLPRWMIKALGLQKKTRPVNI